MKFWKSHGDATPRPDHYKEPVKPLERPELPIVEIAREPMPLRYRDLRENEVFEIGDCLFIRMDDGDAYCFHSGMIAFVRKGRHKIEDMQTVRLSIHIQAHIQGSQLMARPAPK